MHRLPYINAVYTSLPPSGWMLERAFPSLVFYFHLVLIVWRAGMQAKKGRYSDRQWVESSFEVLNRLERAGIRMEISGVETLERLPGPVVFVANHMSMMETMILPVIIQPVTPITYVIKQSLLEYPVFKYVMRSRNPIAVSRSNPRQDLKTVLEEGGARLGDGVSVIVFPQTTRSHSFDRQQMSSIGVKLAKRAGVPVVPIALKTDCWNNGSLVKDCGRLDPSKTAYFRLGDAITVEGKGDAEQEAICDFIEKALQEWGCERECACAGGDSKTITG
jgi:1-acyl-sn-glycerol-3-phosphate acyltransferase